MTRILVTGGAGYIGSHTCKALRRAGFDPISYDNLTRGNPESIKWGVTDQIKLRETLARYRPAAVVRDGANFTGDTAELCAWDHVRASRNPVLSDATTASETLTEYTVGHSFAYEVMGFTSILGKPATPYNEGNPVQYLYRLDSICELAAANRT